MRILWQPSIGSDVEFDHGRSVAQNRPRCIEVRRLKPQTTRRGQDSVRLLEIDSQTPPFVPTKLLREGKLKFKKRSSRKDGRRGLDLRLFEFIMNCREARERGLGLFAACFRERKIGFEVFARAALTAVKI